MRAALFCFIVVAILTFVSYRAMTSPPDAPVVAPIGESEAELHALLGGDDGPWL